MFFDRHGQSHGHGQVEAVGSRPCQGGVEVWYLVDLGASTKKIVPIPNAVVRLHKSISGDQGGGSYKA